MKGRWLSGSWEAPDWAPWLHGWMNDRTKGCELDTLFDRDASLLQVCGGNLWHEFIRRERQALAGCREAGAATGIGGANGRAEDCPGVDGALGEDVMVETGASAA